MADILYFITYWILWAEHYIRKVWKYFSSFISYFLSIILWSSVLAFRYSVIYREIPEKICELESLQSLIAINNQIDSLPSELFTLPEILKVDLSNNKLQVRHKNVTPFSFALILHVPMIHIYVSYSNIRAYKEKSLEFVLLIHTIIDFFTVSLKLYIDETMSLRFRFYQYKYLNKKHINKYTNT